MGLRVTDACHLQKNYVRYRNIVIYVFWDPRSNDIVDGYDKSRQFAISNTKLRYS